MSNTIKITCPKCQTAWEKSLHELEKTETIYRGERKRHGRNVVEYRAACPVCGTHVVLEVEED